MIILDTDHISLLQHPGSPEGQRLQRETISPTILQLRAIEKWDGKFPQVIGGAMPFIDVNTLTPRK